MLNGLQSIIHPNQLCEECLVENQFCKSFLKESTSKVSQPQQEIHVDVCGPIKPCLFGKYMYFLFLLIIEKLGYTS
jgi:ribosomal protein L31